jgi:hypothetical protein
LILTAFISVITPLSFVNAEEAVGAEPSDEKKVQFSSVFTNDFLGDGKDRWRSSSLDISMTFGAGDLGVLPTSAFERFELRFRSEIISPANLTTPAANDRQYAGVLGLGAFTHFQKNAYDIYYGGELVFVGDATGVGSFHDSAHDALSSASPSAAVLNAQVPNAIYPTVHAGISKSYRSDNRLIRPFAEAQAGAETLVRVGADAIFGTAMINDFLLRDSVSGQVVTHSKSDNSKGFGFLVGADAAYVADSNYLPNSGTTSLENFRPRARAGAVFQSQKIDAFYGVTWLGKEFASQPDSQVVGTVSLRLNV